MREAVTRERFNYKKIADIFCTEAQKQMNKFHRTILITVRESFSLPFYEVVAEHAEQQPVSNNN